MQPDGAGTSSDVASSLLIPNRTKLAFNFDTSAPPSTHNTPSKTTIRIPPTSAMAPSTRSGRQRTMSIASAASGSEYHESNASSMDADMDAEVDDDLPDNQPEEEVKYTATTRGRNVKVVNYVESDNDELDVIDQKDEPMPPADSAREDSLEMEQQPRRAGLRNRKPVNGGAAVIESDEDGEPQIGRRLRNRSVPSQQPQRHSGRNKQRGRSRNSRNRKAQPTRRSTRNSAHDPEDDGNYEETSDMSADADGSLDDAEPSSPEPEAEEEDGDGIIDVNDPDDGNTGIVEDNGKPYSLRKRQEINYAIPIALEEMSAPPKPRGGGSRSNGRLGGNKRKGPGWSATGRELDRWMNVPGDDSDSDNPTRTPRKGLGGLGGGGMFAGSVGNTGGMIPADLAAGTPSNMGKVGDAMLADVDPLGVNQNVTFDEVGGLDDHINALKEMTLLPLLYPEVFQRFNVTPPRGVLFHGPPGTGKTLLARALAASCRSNGKGISFFMRKGADILSKWVGEAERQLRLLFEEAKNQQPSIIFFDEIDGLAPVRSSKQDQIHASIVSTLLALMDGMDGRGQVVVIGATNRPDAIDPALRRPGRFDREFYFPLPSLEARERILHIMTKKWAGWDEEKGEDNCKGLAKLTKGYGGADLRALCTEAALNAVQRRYPQIYKSNERLLLDPTSINVELRDFMISVRKLIPSSARATASTAAPLPTQLVPLLNQSVETVKDLISRVLPISKKRSALEEAEWEDDGDVNALDREMMLQAMETLRVHRPRIAVHGAVGMGQEYVAAAALHYLEGYHIQNLDLGTLIGDSTRTPEATIVQLFVEAKRHQPAVVYIPSLATWSVSVSDTARATVRAMLDSLVPTDPVLLLAVVDGAFETLPPDVRAWFGPVRDNRVELTAPSTQQREEFFQGLITDIRRRPTQFPDGVKRKKRVLEDLPVAPPLAPREPSAAELAVQEESDVRTILSLQYRLGLILTELKRKYKRFTKRAADEYNYDFFQVPIQVEPVAPHVEMQENTAGEIVEVANGEQTHVAVEEPPVENGIQEEVPPVQAQVQQQMYDMDLERVHINLYREKYLKPDDFLEDISKIVSNAEMRVHEDAERFYRAQAMFTATRLSLSEIDAPFRQECERMASRERKRREQRRKAKGKDKAIDPQGPAPSIRRSGRTNGLEPELTITDPVQLERRLKRQRSAEANQSPSDDERDREAKRSRLNSADAEAAVEGAQPSQPQDAMLATPHRAHGVRFADDFGPPLAAPNFLDVHIPAPEPSTPRKPSDIGSLLNPITSPQDAPILTGFAGPSGSTSVTVAPFTAESSSAEPILEPPSLNGTVLSLQQVGSAPLQSQSDLQSSTIPLQPEAGPSQPRILGMPEIPPVEDVFMDAGTPQAAGTAKPTTPSPEPMEIVAREPTPLPDFVLDEAQLADLHDYLRDSTHSLTIEQLEQLRASCLSTVWRHRAEWDRNGLLQELRTLVNTFVQDVAAAEGYL